MKSLLFAIPVLLLAGCSSHDGAEDAVRALLTDPDSAQFKDWEQCPSGHGWSGKVNSKTPAGGYGGYTDFVYDKSIASLQVPEDYGYYGMYEECHNMPDGSLENAALQEVTGSTNESDLKNPSN